MKPTFSAIKLWLGPLAALALPWGPELEAGTPPNAIVFATGRLKMKDMLLSGLWLNVLCGIFLTLASLYFLPLVFG